MIWVGLGILVVCVGLVAGLIGAMIAVPRWPG